MDDLVQKSEDWLQMRAGKVTASRFKDVMNTLKSGKPGQKRKDYLIEIVAEKLTGQPSAGFTNTAMQWGIDHEQEAREAYEEHTASWVDEYGFVLLDEDEFCEIGCSPDGFVAEGGIEIKCPYNSSNHIKTLQNSMPDEHIHQVQGCMWVTDRKWWDFVSYDPRMPEGLKLYVQRIERDDKYINELRDEIEVFLLEAHQLIKSLKGN